MHTYGAHFRVSRRAFIRNAALAGVGAAIGASPFFPLLAAAEDWPNLRALARDYVAKRRVANMVVCLGRGEAEPDFLAEGRDTMGGHRYADGDSLYRIYSMTKPITGMAAMILIAEGRMALDQPLAEILPKFARMQVQKHYDGSIGPENLEPAARPITIRHLLTHTSGLGYSIIQQGPIKRAMEEAGVIAGQISRIPVPGLSRGEPVRSLALFADRLAEIPLVYQPGTHWSYSYGLDLMGRVIEVVSGMPFDAFLKERILGPCGMSSTWFRVPESDAFRLTSNYAVVDGSLMPFDPPSASVYLDEPAFPFGGSGLVSSPRDYDRFLKMLAGYGMREGRRIMPEAAVRMGTSDLLPDPSVAVGTLIEGYGFGAGGRVGWAGSRNAFGWAGAAGTVGFVDLDKGLRAGLFTQYMPAQAYPIYDDFERAVTGDLQFQKDES